MQRLVLALCLCLQGSLVAPALGQSDAPTREYEIKAAFLYHFARFVEWSGEDAEEEMALCVLGSDPFGRALDNLEGKAVRDRALTVRRLDGMQAAQSCHILFISASEQGRLPQLLNALQAGEVLTVGETKTFTKDGGMIRLFEAGNKIRFEVNLEAARRAQLTISSRMLKLADVL